MATHLLLVDAKRLLHVGHFRGANGKSLDLAGSESAQVTHRLHVSGSDELSEPAGPAHADFQVLARWLLLATNELPLDSPHVGGNLRQHDFHWSRAANQGRVDAVLGDGPRLLAHFRDLGGVTTTVVSIKNSLVSLEACSTVCNAMLVV